MIQIAIVTVSDSAFEGTREDVSGPKLRERAEELGWKVATQALVPDEPTQISAILRRLTDTADVSVILTTGGTGVALRDVTPEATRSVIEREIPGVAEVMRAEGSKRTPLAALSRAVAGVRCRTLILNLPGSPKGAVESLDAIAKLVPHIVDLLEGRTGHGDVPH
jgi:molybdopterin adenylyltransferase